MTLRSFAIRLAEQIFWNVAKDPPSPFPNEAADSNSDNNLSERLWTTIAERGTFRRVNEH
jgi:hypothetical protein